MKSTRKYLAILMACLMLVALFAGCKTGDDTTTTAPATGTGTPATDTPASDGPSSGNDTLVIGTTEFNGVFNYLFYNTAYDANVINLIDLAIYDGDRGGALVSGVCEYKTPEVIKDAAGKDVGAKYTFKIKDGIKFSDGEAVTADDIIFTYKVMASPAYEGLAALQTLPIPGINEYRYDDPNYKAKLAEIETEAKNIPDEDLVAACKDMAVADYETPDYGPEGLITDLGLTIDAALTAGSDEYKTAVIDAATKAYHDNFADFFLPELIAAKQQKLTLEYVNANMASGEKVKDISGIKKVDDMTVEVTVDGIDPTAEASLAIHILPEHYYGEGITKTDLSKMKEKNGKPMGGGPYIFDDFKDGVVTLHANPDYFKGKPNIEKVVFQTIPTTDQATAAANGTVDVMEVSCTPDNVKLMEDNGKFNYIYDRNGWGYVGVSAKKIPDINIRKGLMFAMNRDLGVKTYYGDLAVVLERPITMASWGYPSDNTPVYTYDLAKAKESFLAAGYKEEGGKLVKDGKVLKFDAYISSTDHPVNPLYTQMKNDLEAMGCEFAISQLDWGAYSEQYQDGDLMIWAAAYGDGSPDPDCYQMFHTDSIAAKNNPYQLSDPAVDSLIMQGRGILDQEARKPIYNELYKKIMETATVMPYYQRMEMYVINPDKVDVDTLVQDPDPFYGFYAGIDKLKLK